MFEILIVNFRHEGNYLVLPHKLIKSLLRELPYAIFHELFVDVKEVNFTLFTEIELTSDPNVLCRVRYFRPRQTEPLISYLFFHLS